MSDYEMFSTFTEIWNTVWLIFTVHTTVTFAFLVAGYLIADKLSSKMITVVVSMYSMVFGWCLLSIDRFTANGLALGFEIKRSVEMGNSELDWTTMANEPDSVLLLLPVIIWIVFLGSYAGSIVFLFYQRHAKGEKNSS